MEPTAAPLTAQLNAIWAYKVPVRVEEWLCGKVVELNMRVNTPRPDADHRRISEQESALRIIGEAMGLPSKASLPGAIG